MSEPAIMVRRLTKKYGRRIVLRELEFDIGEGEIFGLFGPNGAGKSTFVSILATICKPTSGDIFVYMHSVCRQPGSVREKIGFAPQDIALYPMMSGRENLDFWAGIYGLRGGLKRERILEAASVVNLEDRLDERVSSYSGGMRRRLNIAAAIMHRPMVLVMDEPTAGVDMWSRRCIFDALLKLRSEGRTIIFTSHAVDELETICDRIAVLDRGEQLSIIRTDGRGKVCGSGELAQTLLQMYK